LKLEREVGKYGFGEDSTNVEIRQAKSSAEKSKQRRPGRNSMQDLQETL
jgi:hypothetical protein